VNLLVVWSSVPESLGFFLVKNVSKELLELAEAVQGDYINASENEAADRVESFHNQLKALGQSIQDEAMGVIRLDGPTLVVSCGIVL
jgi:hypothetical protein